MLIWILSFIIGSLTVVLKYKLIPDWDELKFDIMCSLDDRESLKIWFWVLAIMMYIPYLNFSIGFIYTLNLISKKLKPKKKG